MPAAEEKESYALQGLELQQWLLEDKLRAGMQNYLGLWQTGSQPHRRPMTSFMGLLTPLGPAGVHGLE